MEMKKLNTFVFLLFPICALGQNELTVQINSLRNNVGVVQFEIQTEKEISIGAYTLSIENKRSKITIKNLKPGKYIFKYFHDENKNKKMDSNWLGIPTEGYGFSNNAKGLFGPPSIKETIFELKSTATYVCTPIYY